MQNVYMTINKFHEKKRRLEYANIKRKLNIPDEDVVIQSLNLVTIQKERKEETKT